MNKEEEILLINIIKDTISGEEHLGNKLKEKCIDYVDNLQQIRDKAIECIKDFEIQANHINDEIYLD